MESQRLLPPQSNEHHLNTPPSSEDDQDADEWSSYSSYYSDESENSTIPDWEPYIDDFTGELLYIDCHPFVTQNTSTHIINLNNKDSSTSSVIGAPFSKTQLRRSTRGKFLRLIRRKESKRRSSKKMGHKIDFEPNNTAKVKFQDCHEGEEKEVMLEVDSENRHNLSSEKSLAESLLGLIVSTLSDGNRVMIAGFSYDSKAKNERNIKIGDWLKSINNIDINVDNLDDILQKYINHTEVLLKLQRVAAYDVTQNPPINELNSESNFVKELLNSRPSSSDDDKMLMQSLLKHCVGVAFIDTGKLSCESGSFDDVSYAFPRPIQNNLLCISRGIFVTLNDLMRDVVGTTPKVVSIFARNRLVHVIFDSFGSILMLLMLPDTLASDIFELSEIKDGIVRFLTFTIGSIDTRRFGANVDTFFTRLFVRLLRNGSWMTSEEFLRCGGAIEVGGSCRFDDDVLMGVVPYLRLKDEAQMQIDDALAELEASDYREWNEDPLDCQRLFTILGGAVFHSGHLLASHLLHEDLVDVVCFCKHQGLFHLSQTEPVKSLVLWREVFPKTRIITDNQTTKYYLLVVGAEKDILAVIMEAGGCTEVPDYNMPPDAFYVEEAQATLSHIQELGLSELAERKLQVNNANIALATPQISISTTKRQSSVNFIGSLSGFAAQNNRVAVNAATVPKKSEVTSILKRRTLDYTVATSTSNTALPPDDSQSESSACSYLSSEVSEERRGLFRGRNDDEDSDEDNVSDDDYMDSSQFSGSSLDLNELRHTLLCDDAKLPQQLTAGLDNVLFHYVQLDVGRGVILCPKDQQVVSKTYTAIVDNFRRCCQIIHALFGNALRFKNMPAQDIAKSVMNKSLIAIKEHGVLFECPFLDDEKRGKVTYWVIGRLFQTPRVTEMYVCYQDSVPQNLIELAFKLNLSKFN